MLTLLTFIALLILRKVSICCARLLSSVLLRKLPIYTKSDQLILLWWAKFESESLLMIFTYFHSKFKVTCKNLMSVYQNSPKLVNSVDILLFFHQNSLANLKSWVIRSLFFVIKPSKCFKMFHSTPNNAKYNVDQSQACFLHTSGYP